MAKKPTYEELEQRVKKLEKEAVAGRQAEEALCKSEESLAMAQEVADVGSWDWNIEKDTLTWSDKTYRQYGLEPNEIIPTYEAFENFIHPDDRDFVNQNVKQALDGDKPYSVHARMISKDKKEWIMHAQGKVYRNEDGNAVRFIGTQQDITERKRIEGELKKHRDHLEWLVEERTDELRKANEQLKHQIVEQKLAEEELQVSERELKIMNRIAEIFLTTTDDTIYDEVLKVVLMAMGSKYGTFAYINEDGDRVVPSMTGDIWEKCKMLKKSIFFPRKAWGDVLWARCIIEKMAISSNGPFKFPNGHVALGRALAVPIIHQGKVVGNFMVGDKATDYDKKDEELLGTIADRVAPILKARLQNKIHESRRKEAEENLRESEKRIQQLMESVPIGISICSPEGDIIEANATMVKLFGYSSKEDFLKTNTSDHYYDIEDRDRFTKTMQKGLVRDFEVQYIRKDSTVFWGHITSLSRITPTGGIQYINTIEDISERMQKDQMIRDLARYPRENPYPVLRIAYDATVLYANGASLPLLNTWRCNIGQTLPDKWRKFTADVFSSGESKDVQVDCDDRTIFLTFAPLKKRGYINVYGLDITQQLRAEEEKRKLEAYFQKAQKFESIGTLAGGIAHDFNNLMMSIQGNTSLMLMDIDSHHPHYERLKNIEKQIQSGANLTSQLLGYASKGRYVVKQTNLNKMVEGTSMAFGRTRKQINIHKNLAEDLYAIEADRGQIEQILLNLFINASDAMPGGGDLYLETKNVTNKDVNSGLYKSKAGNYVNLTVRDTGKGMDKSTMERIFDPFFTTKEMGRGTGLGLASVYGIIKGHGGYIDVESKEKQGTTFEIYLPATTKRVGKAARASEKLIKQTGTVLLVDDEADVRKICMSILEKIGYRVLSAEDGQEAIKLYRNNKDEIDIVLLDMIMPNMSGGEVYDRLKEINPEVKVLLSSGYSIDGEATEILNRGCDSFIQKPFDMKKLSARIGEILNNK